MNGEVMNYGKKDEFKKEINAAVIEDTELYRRKTVEGFPVHVGPDKIQALLSMVLQTFSNIRR